MLCSLAMPADYEVSLSSYTARHRAPTRRPASLQLSVPVVTPAAPRRPCLVVRVDDLSPKESQSSDGELPAQDCDPQSPTRLKKRVVFADDAGQQLTHVKVMTEPSFAPPRWNMAFLSQVTRGATAEVAPEPWEPTFSQPASDYLAFRCRLDLDSVSLENVIVKEAEQVVVGTVKVRNLAFHKEVLIRSTSDDWKTHVDAYCTFVNNGLKTPAVQVLYDTFSFRLPLPPQSRKLEFCVCYRCNETEYWDSNAGKNYVLVKKSSSYNPSAMDDLSSKIGGLGLGYLRTSPSYHPGSGPQGPNEYASDDALSIGKKDDALYAKVDSWSEFASWNHLSVEGPYW